MNSLQSSLLAGATALTLATSAEATPQNVTLDSVEKVTHILADTTNSGDMSWGEVFFDTAVFGTFCFMMYKLTGSKKR